ncbi:MAG TPA: hypothetical protein VFG63_10555 [Nocardioidaceae bacterium]|nr:hypothetical protein [Nocardioidaceae bacterium]
MGNVNLPTPVALAAVALCILGGYLLGWVSGPDTPSRTTATVESYDPGSGRLCLTGDTVDDQEGKTEEETLCGTWRRSEGSTFPQPGDRFRFVSMVADASRKGESGGGPVTVIYGDVVK